MYDVMREYQKKNVVIYARVSTEHEAQISALENQIDWYKPILEGHKEWHLVSQYIDEGITGTSAKKRPQFMKMMRDAKNHKFDMILTREVSRFARNTVDTLQYTRMLRSIGVEVFFINDNIKTFDGDGELRLTIMATLAQDESRKTSVRVRAGQQTSMEKGVIYGTGNILGYDRVDGNYIINEEQAKTVRKIYDLYLAGYGFQKIRYELESGGYKTATGKTRWYDSTISRILRNSIYCGTITYHKSYVTDFLEQKRKHNFGEKEYTYAKGPHEPIISEKEYFDVQARLSKRSTVDVIMKNGDEVHRSRPICPPSSAWSRLLECECGRRTSRKKWNRTNGVTDYGHLCYAQTNRGTIVQKQNHNISTDGECDTPMIPEWKLEMFAGIIFRNYVKDTDKVIRLAQDIVTQHFAEKTDIVDHSAEIAAKEDEIIKLKRKFDNYLEMRSEGEITKETFQMKSDELNMKMSLLTVEIQKLQDEEESKQPADYSQMLEDLKRELESYGDFEKTKVVPEDIVEAFIERIVIHKDSLEWHLRTKPAEKDYDETVGANEFARVMKAINTEPVQDHEPVLIDSFTVTKEDAKNYVYSIDSHKRVHRWNDLRMDIYV